MMRKFLALLALLPGLASAAITYVGSGAATARATNTNTASPALHASTTSGDTIIVIAAYTHDAGDGGSVTTPSGYTLIGSAFEPNGTFDLMAYCKIAGASESAPTIGSTDGTDATGDVKIAQAITLRGTVGDCATIVAHSASASTTSNANDLPHVGLTVSTANTAVLVVGGKRDDVTSVDLLTTDALSWTEVAEGTTTTGDDATLVAALNIQTTATSIGAGAFTLVPSTGQTGRHTSLVLSLASTVSGPGSPPVGKTDVTVASIGAGTWCEDFNSTATPDIAVGDTIRIDENTDGGFALTHGTDCSLEYSGDGSRQLVEYDIYDTSAAGWMSGGPGLLVFNNQPPSCETPSGIDLILDVGTASSPLDIVESCVDPESDALTCSLTSGTLPTGLSLGGTGNCTLSGTPTVENESGAAVTFTLSDGYGGTATQEYTLYPLDTVTVADCTTAPTAVADCAALIEADGWLVASATFSCHPTVAVGDVVSQSPTAASEVEPFTEVDLVVSLGTCTTTQKPRMRLGLGLGVN